MPDDIAAHAASRGALPVTIRARMEEGQRLQRHAAWRLPASSPDAPLIDQLHEHGLLDSRQYANACACLRLYEAAGLGRSRGVASWSREGRGTASGEGYGPEDEWRALLRDGGVGMEAVCMLLRGEALGPYMLGRATRHLDGLDGVAARWEGERWRAE